MYYEAVFRISEALAGVSFVVVVPFSALSAVRRPMLTFTKRETLNPKGDVCIVHSRLPNRDSNLVRIGKGVPKRTSVPILLIHETGSTNLLLACVECEIVCLLGPRLLYHTTLEKPCSNDYAGPFTEPIEGLSEGKVLRGLDRVFIWFVGVLQIW